MGDYAIIHTGWEIVREKRIKWYIDHFDLFGGKVENFIDQNFEFSFGDVGRIPALYWKVKLWEEIETPRNYYDGDELVYRENFKDNLKGSVKLGHAPKYPNNIGMEFKSGDTFYTATASIIDSDGKSTWKGTTRSEIRDLACSMSTTSTVPMSLIRTLTDKEFNDLPLQENGSLLLEITINILRKKFAATTSAKLLVTSAKEDRNIN